MDPFNLHSVCEIVENGKLPVAHLSFQYKKFRLSKKSVGDTEKNFCSPKGKTRTERRLGAPGRRNIDTHKRSGKRIQSTEMEKL